MYDDDSLDDYYDYDDEGDDDYDAVAHMTGDPVGYYTRGYGGFGYDTSHVPPDDAPSELSQRVEDGDEAAVRRLVEAAASESDEEKHRVLNSARRWTEKDYRMSGFVKTHEWFDITPLAAAACKGRHGIVQFLLEQGADPTLTGCPSHDIYWNALDAANHTVRNIDHIAAMTRGGPQRCVDLLKVATLFWGEAKYSGPHYSKDGRKSFTNRPTIGEGLLILALAEVPGINKYPLDGLKEEDFKRLKEKYEDLKRSKEEHKKKNSQYPSAKVGSTSKTSAPIKAAEKPLNSEPNTNTNPQQSGTTGIKLVSTDKKKHPQFGSCSSAKNIETKCYKLGNLTVKFIKEEWWDSYDTDSEFWIEMGSLCFDMFPGDYEGYVESRMGMNKGRWGDQVALLVTKIKDGPNGQKGTPISVKIEEGSASKMNKEWAKLAKASGLSAKKFNDCLIKEFNIYWFGGTPFLPALAAEEAAGKEFPTIDCLKEEESKQAKNTAAGGIGNLSQKKRGSSHAYVAPNDGCTSSKTSARSTAAKTPINTGNNTNNNNTDAEGEFRFHFGTGNATGGSTPNKQTSKPLFAFKNSAERPTKPWSFKTPTGFCATTNFQFGGTPTSTPTPAATFTFDSNTQASAGMFGFNAPQPSVSRGSGTPSTTTAPTAATLFTFGSSTQSSTSPFGLSPSWPNISNGSDTTSTTAPTATTTFTFGSNTQASTATFGLSPSQPNSSKESDTTSNTARIDTASFTFGSNAQASSNSFGLGPSQPSVARALETTGKPAGTTFTCAPFSLGSTSTASAKPQTAHQSLATNNTSKPSSHEPSSIEDALSLLESAPASSLTQYSDRLQKLARATHDLSGAPIIQAVFDNGLLLGHILGFEGSLAYYHKHYNRIVGYENPLPYDWSDKYKDIPGAAGTRLCDTFERIPGNRGNLLVCKTWHSFVIGEEGLARWRSDLEGMVAKKISVAKRAAKDTSLSWTARICAWAVANDTAALKAAFKNPDNKSSGIGAALAEQKDQDFVPIGRDHPFFRHCLCNMAENDGYDDAISFAASIAYAAALAGSTEALRLIEPLSGNLWTVAFDQKGDGLLNSLVQVACANPTLDGVVKSISVILSNYDRKNDNWDILHQRHYGSNGNHLHLAAACGHADLVEVLINGGMQANRACERIAKNYYDDYGEYCSYDEYESYDEYASDGSDRSEKKCGDRRDKGVTDHPLPVHWASVRGHQDVVDLIHTMIGYDDQVKERGCCKTFNRARGFGFIKRENGGRDIFVHISNIEDEEPLDDGETVEFVIEKTARGPQALDVTRVGWY